MNLPGMKWLRRAEETGNQVDVPMTRQLGLVEFVKLVFKQAGEDHVGAFAGNLVYNGVFAIFPFLTLLLSVLGLFNMTSLVSSMISQAGQVMPASAVTFLRDQVLPITRSRANGAFTIAAIISIVAALWGVSGAFRSVMEAMNVMYNVEDHRPLWKRYLISILLAVAVVVLLIAAFALLAFGPSIIAGIGNSIGLGTIFYWISNVIRWPILAFLVLLSFALMYYYAPDVEQRFRFITPGSLIAFLAWLLFSVLFSLYVNSFSNYNKSYGTFAGIALLLLYFYYSSFILLFGAEMNQVIEQHAPGGKQPGEKVPESGR